VCWDASVGVWGEVVVWLGWVWLHLGVGGREHVDDVERWMYGFVGGLDR
jgi:hypothetical protein